MVLGRYTSVFQRIFALLVWASLVILLLGVFVVGVTFFWLTLTAFVVAYIAWQCYLLVKAKFSKQGQPEDASFVSEQVRRGDFRTGPGRIIEHSQDDE